MSSPLETLVREEIRTADKNTSRVEICTVCEFEHYPFFHCGSARKALMKRNSTTSVIGFIVVALYNTSNTLHNCCSNENFKAVQQTVGTKSSLDNSYISRMKPDLVWGEPLTSLPLIRKPTSGTRASNGGRKISTKTVRKKRLPVIVMSWNLVWWLTTSDYFQKCKHMEYQNSGPSGTLR